MTSTWSTPSLRIHIAAVAATAMLLVFGVGGWAATAQLSGAVIAAGTLVVDTNVKKVQHPSGGVVGEVRVRDGQKVELGEVLVRLDETHTRANLTIIVNSLDELAARQARLEAERDGVQFVLRLSRRSFPFIAKAFADMGFAGDGPANATAITVQIVRKPPTRSGSPFTRADGSSNGSSPGSSETGGSGRTPKRRSHRPEPSSTPPPSCSSRADWPDIH